MRHIISFCLSFLLLTSLFSCRGSEARIPDKSTPTRDSVKIYPDYQETWIPYNIAPLNFRVNTEGDEFVVVLEGAGRQVIAAARADEAVQFDSLEWRNLLVSSKGKTIAARVYAKRSEGWVEHPSFTIHVAAEPIDRYLSYRLIEPSYQLYRQLGLYQRDLEKFNVKTIYENNREAEEEHNHCINCHNFQNYSTRRMLFHVRGKHGGTVFIHDGKAEKLDMKVDSVLSNSVYPSWHPEKPWVVFSSNQTGQVFHMINKDKIEVVDYGSDLVFFDAEKREIRNILRTRDELETFPCWSPDGKSVFYCSAAVPAFHEKSDLDRQDIISNIYGEVRYNLMSIPFDPATRTFGTPRLEMDCAAVGKSAAVPRVSPDGRYVVFTLSDFGQFHIWHSSSDLYLKDLQSGEIRPLSEANSSNVDSYHSWSSNGRWIVFSSRRDDGSYTRPYFSYIDKNGQSHKAFILPQLDPEQNILLTKSYNVPELTRDAVQTTPEQLKKVIYDDKATGKITYKK